MKPSDSRNCPFCGTRVNNHVLICPSCEKNISVCAITERVTDKNIKHNLIKDLLELDSGSLFNNYSKLNMQLDKNNQIIVRGISQHNANLVKNTFRKHGVDVRVEPIQFADSHKDDYPNLGKPEKQTYKRYIDLLLILLIAAIGFVYVRKIHFKKSDKDIKLSTQTYDNKLGDEPTDKGLRPDAEQLKQSGIKNKISKLVAATVLIRGKKSTGSGFLIREDGYILTNYHVIKHQDDLTVQLENGNKYKPQIVKIQPGLDLALLKIDGEEFPFLKLGDARKMQRGYDVWTIGAPKQLAFSVAKGVISYNGRNINGIKYIQSDVAINPGNSGGPMISEDGKVIGILTFMVTKSEGLNFALPINYTYSGPFAIAKSIIDHEMESGEEGYPLSSPTEERIMARFEDPPKNKATKSEGSKDDDTMKQYTESVKNLTSEFQRRRQEVLNNQEILRLKKSEIQDKYYEHKGGISISDEVQAGKETRRLEIAIIEKDIEVMELTIDYNRNISNLLSEALIFMKNPGEEDRARAKVESLKQESEILRENIKAKKAELEQIKNRTI